MTRPLVRMFSLKQLVSRGSVGFSVVVVRFAGSVVGLRGGSVSGSGQITRPPSNRNLSIQTGLSVGSTSAGEMEVK